MPACPCVFSNPQNSTGSRHLWVTHAFHPCSQEAQKTRLLLKTKEQVFWGKTRCWMRLIAFWDSGRPHDAQGTQELPIWCMQMSHTGVKSPEVTQTRYLEGGCFNVKPAGGDDLEFRDASFIKATFTRMGWSPKIVSIYISLVAGDVEYLLRSSLPICSISSSEISVFNSNAHF